MINRDDIEAGDKVHTRDGGCLVAYGTPDIYLGTSSLGGWRLDGASKIFPHLDIIRIEKAPKPVATVRWIGLDREGCSMRMDEESAMQFDNAIKLTFINGKLEKSEQMK
jgi:hypothetical protein